MSLTLDVTPIPQRQHHHPHHRIIPVPTTIRPKPNKTPPIDLTPPIRHLKLLDHGR